MSRAIHFPLIRKEYDLDNYYQRCDLIGSIAGGLVGHPEFVTEFLTGIVQHRYLKPRNYDRRRSDIKALEAAEKELVEAIHKWNSARVASIKANK